MNCPNCHHELTQDFYENKVNFICSSCGGRTLSIAALRSLCGDRKFTDLLWQTARYGYSQPGTPCPSCGKVMRRVTLPLAGTPFELDLCCSCQLIWFDQNELEQIPMPEPEQVEDLLQKAKEILAMRMIEKEEKRLESFLQSSSSDKDAPDEAWKYLPALLGLPVEQNATPCQRFPFLTLGIAILCLAVGLLSMIAPVDPIQEWGFIPIEWNRHYGLTILTSQFLHAG